MDERCRLYLITPPALNSDSFADTLARALDAGDVGALQIRLKNLDDDALRHAIDRLRPVAHDRGVAVILNDRPDLVAATGCDGAHIGQEDGDVIAARALLGDLTLGVSCHGSRDLAMSAGEAGADYVAFGAFYPSTSKEVVPEATPDLLTWWSEMMELPSVAIGGIDPTNAAPLVKAGADFLAVIGAVWNHPDGPDAGVKALNTAIQAALTDDL